MCWCWCCVLLGFRFGLRFASCVDVGVCVGLVLVVLVLVLVVLVLFVLCCAVLCS